MFTLTNQMADHTDMSLGILVMSRYSVPNYHYVCILPSCIFWHVSVYAYLCSWVWAYAYFSLLTTINSITSKIYHYPGSFFRAGKGSLLINSNPCRLFGNDKPITRVLECHISYRLYIVKKNEASYNNSFKWRPTNDAKSFRTMWSIQNIWRKVKDKRVIWCRRIVFNPRILFQWCSTNCLFCYFLLFKFVGN